MQLKLFLFRVDSDDSPDCPITAVDLKDAKLKLYARYIIYSTFNHNTTSHQCGNPRRARCLTLSLTHSHNHNRFD